MYNTLRGINPIEKVKRGTLLGYFIYRNSRGNMSDLISCVSLIQYVSFSMSVLRRLDTKLGFMTGGSVGRVRF